MLKSKLNRKNKILAINILAVALLEYSVGELQWRIEELMTMDRKTMKLMTMNGVMYRTKDDRIYLPRKNNLRKDKMII